MRAIPILLLIPLAACGAQPRTAPAPDAVLVADTIVMAGGPCATADAMPVHRAPGAAAPIPNARADAASAIPNACGAVDRRLVVWRADSTAAAPDSVRPPR